MDFLNDGMQSVGWHKYELSPYIYYATLSSHAHTACGSDIQLKLKPYKCTKRYTFCSQSD